MDEVEEAAGWARVAEYVKSRMRELKFTTQAELARRADVSKPTARIFMTGERREGYGYPGEEMRLKVCAALDWADDSIGFILDGGEPEVVDPSTFAAFNAGIADGKADAANYAISQLRAEVRRLWLVVEKLAAVTGVTLDAVERQDATPSGPPESQAR